MPADKLARFAYFGTPEFSTLVLDELLEAGFIPSLIVTTPDRPAGRGLALTESPVKKWAVAHEIPIAQFETYDDAALATLQAAKLDFLVVAAYGKILPASVLLIPRLGALNVHPSLLPRYKGTSPVESQILADEKEVGVSVILMDEKMDHGPIVAQEKIDIANWPISRNTLNTLLWSAGGKLLASVLPKWLAGEVHEQEQDHTAATLTKKIKKEDGEIDLAVDGRANYLKYLAYEGWPGTYFFKDGKRIKITAASFKDGRLVIERVVPEGGREIPYTD